MLPALIICVQFSREPTNAFKLVNVILFPDNNRHVSATHVGIFRVMRTKIQTQLLCVDITAESIQLLCVDITPESIIIGF
jgi:hypothetical protein